MAHKATEFMVMARRPDGQYFYARELFSEVLADSIRCAVEPYMFEKLVGDILYFRDPEQGGVGTEATWRGETAVALVADPEDLK